MRKASLLAAVLMAALAAGCRAAPLAAPSEEPPWVRAPSAADQGGRFLVVGGSSEFATDEPTTRVAADHAARGALGAAVEDYTHLMVAAFLDAHPDYAPPSDGLSQEFASVLSVEVAAAVLRQSGSTETWREPDGKTHVLYRTAFADLNRQIVARLPVALAHVNPFGRLSAQAAEQMESFLAGEFERRVAEAARERPAPPPVGAARSPTWVELGPGRGYPAAQFVTAIGFGHDLQAAEDSARAELTARLQVQLAGLVREATASKPAGNLAQNLAWLGPRGTALSADKLIGVRVAERWHDVLNDTHYVLVVVDRDTVALMYRAATPEAAERAVSLCAAGANHWKAENRVAALKDCLDGVAAGAEAVRLQLGAMATVAEADVPEFRAIISTPVLARAKEELQSLLDAISVEKVSGDRQWMAPGAPPAQPFEVRVHLAQSGRPVAGLPMRLLDRPGARMPPLRATTDPSGMARWDMRQAPPAADADTRLVAELDLAALSPQADLHRLRAPQTAFEYVVRSRQNSHVLVYVRERAAGGSLPADELADELRQALRAAGFHLAAGSEILKRLAPPDLMAESADDEILGAVVTVQESLGPGQFLVVAVGEISVRLQEVINTTEGRLFIVYCPYELKVLDGALPPGQRTVLRVTGSGREAYLEDELEARRRARADATAQMKEQLVTGLGSRLGPAAGR